MTTSQPPARGACTARVSPLTPTCTVHSRRSVEVGHPPSSRPTPSQRRTASTASSIILIHPLRPPGCPSRHVTSCPHARCAVTAVSSSSTFTIAAFIARFCRAVITAAAALAAHHAPHWPPPPPFQSSPCPPRPPPAPPAPSPSRPSPDVLSAAPHPRPSMPRVQLAPSRDGPRSTANCGPRRCRWPGSRMPDAPGSEASSTIAAHTCRRRRRGRLEASPIKQAIRRGHMSRAGHPLTASSLPSLVARPPLPGCGGLGGGYSLADAADPSRIESACARPPATCRGVIGWLIPPGEGVVERGRAALATAPRRTPTRGRHSRGVAACVSGLTACGVGPPAAATTPASDTGPPRPSGAVPGPPGPRVSGHARDSST